MGVIPSNKKKVEKPFTNYVSWFEIPAVNFKQAVNFYNHIYGIEMEENFNGNHSMAFFPAKNGIGGAVVAGPGSTPSDTGALIYLNGGQDLNNILSKIAEAGGRIVMPKTLINEEHGYFAIFIDTEGNKLALHSKN
ncbi:VOC family protein [Aquiflexum sp.]|uniref:VOC family protein n=1 Tax=Aquiflexum sp. TaxID=1872584 RepID=UPI003592F89C